MWFPVYPSLNPLSPSQHPTNAAVSITCPCHYLLLLTVPSPLKLSHFDFCSTLFMCLPSPESCSLCVSVSWFVFKPHFLFFPVYCLLPLLLASAWCQWLSLCRASWFRCELTSVFASARAAGTSTSRSSARCTCKELLVMELCSAKSSPCSPAFDSHCYFSYSCLAVFSLSMLSVVSGFFFFFSIFSCTVPTPGFNFMSDFWCISIT